MTATTELAQDGPDIDPVDTASPDDGGTGFIIDKNRKDGVGIDDCSVHADNCRQHGHFPLQFYDIDADGIILVHHLFRVFHHAKKDVLLRFFIGRV